jgi:hypothetical protein
MKPRASRSTSLSQLFRIGVAVLCMVLLVFGDSVAMGQAAAAPADEAPMIPNDQLDSLVAPIALYPDPLLAQLLAASTYPLEIIQLQQWLEKNKELKGDALTAAVEKQDWDPSVQAMSAFPDVVKQLGDNIKWTSELGNAFLAQQSDVMAAVQRMRKKAMDAGNLKSTEQQKIETKVVETKTVVIIEPASPQVVYVPSYNPVVVYGPPVYPYPPIYYPPPGYYAAGMAISFGIGVAMGAAWGGGWGWGCGWGRNNTVNINVNNNYINHYNKTNINNKIGSGNNNNWRHNPQHRGGAPYSNRTTANKYGGSARGDSVATRQANARQNQGQTGNRQQAGARPSQGQVGGGASNMGANRASAGGAGNKDANRAAAGGAGNAGANRGSSSDRVGNRQVPNTPSSKNTSAFGGASSGMSGGQARASSNRGTSSMGTSRGGGGGGGGRRK